MSTEIQRAFRTANAVFQARTAEREAILKDYLASWRVLEASVRELGLDPAVALFHLDRGKPWEVVSSVARVIDKRADQVADRARMASIAHGIDASRLAVADARVLDARAELQAVFRRGETEEDEVDQLPSEFLRKMYVPGHPAHLFPSIDCRGGSIRTKKVAVCGQPRSRAYKDPPTGHVAAMAHRIPPPCPDCADGRLLDGPFEEEIPVPQPTYRNGAWVVPKVEPPPPPPATGLVATLRRWFRPEAR